MNMDIRSFIKEQFPDIYHREGKTFIAFMEHYFEWLQSQGNIVDHIGKLSDYNDIDRTLDEFLDYYVKKYMADLPLDVVQDKRFLQKHIIDLYNSKGSPAGLKLLFMLLYGEEIDIYIPQKDVITTDESTWVVPKYFEIQYEPYVKDFIGKYVYGFKSKAKALVETYERRNINGKIIHMLFVSHIEGNFKKGEIIYTNELGIDKSIIIKGSVEKLEILDGINFKIGDILWDEKRPVDGLKCVVTETTKTVGIMNFTLIDGGKGYGMDAIIEITTGTNTSGSGASFRIGGLRDTTTFEYSPNLVKDHANVLLSAATYDNGSNDTSAFATANINTLLIDAFEMKTKTVGTIDYILVDSVGSGYDGSVNVKITDPHTSPYYIPDGKGGYWGQDAVVEGKASIGEGVISKVEIFDSSVGYDEFNDKNITITDGNQLLTAKTIWGGIGKTEGYWVDEKSFIDYDKKLQDDYYWQEFSYEIRSSKPFQKYKDIVKKIMHLAGNELFGKVLIKDKIVLETQETVTVTQ